MTRHRSTILLAVALVVAVAVLILAWPRERPADAARRVAARAESAAVRARGAMHLPPDLPAPIARLLRQGRSWHAARRLRAAVGPGSSARMVLTTARAEAEWGNWDRVRALLASQPWRDGGTAAEGWLLLGRARAQAGRWAEAADAFATALRAAPGDTLPEPRAAIELRYALAALRASNVDQGVAALAHLRSHSTAAAGWASLLAADALAARGDTARAARLAAQGATVSTTRAARALADAYLAARAPAAGRARLAMLPGAARVAGEDRAGLLASSGRLALEAGDTATARADLRAALAAAPQSDGAGQAASLLAPLPGLTPADRALLADTFSRRGVLLPAAEQFRAWLASETGASAAAVAEVRLRLGRTLFGARRYAEAARVLAAVPDSPLAALLLGRAQLRGAPGSGVTTLLGVASRFPSAPEAAQALFVAADAASDTRAGTANALYRRIVRDYPDAPAAPTAAARVAGPALLAGDAAAAARLWEDLAARSTRPANRAAAAYWAGRSRLAMGDSAAGRVRLRNARSADPVSYYAVLAARRLGEPYTVAALPPGPPVDPAERAALEARLAAADLLRQAGQLRDAEAEVNRIVRTTPDSVPVRYALAEALIAREYPVQAIRIGRALDERGEAQNARLLRIIYPFIYREMLTAEAAERGLDPALVAAMTRQESAFYARARSPVGARGLMQVMPSTGRALAAAERIRGWTPEMLFDPEINAHLGTRFLAEQMRTYDGVLPLVFSAYNAGPTRADRWRRLPEARDLELLTERIPFEETREYVKILTRNISLYRALHGAAFTPPAR